MDSQASWDIPPPSTLLLPVTIFFALMAFCSCSDREPRAYTSVSPLESRLRHQGIWHRRAQDFEEWLLQTEEFRPQRAGSGGREGDYAVLFFNRDPGVCKADIGQRGRTWEKEGQGQMPTSRNVSSFVIHRLCDRGRGQNEAVTCFFFDFAA